MTCHKLRFESKKKAKQKRKAFENRFWKKLTIYKCDQCNAYHYTTHSTIEDKMYFRRNERLENESS